MIDLNKLQEEIYKNKVDKGFCTDNTKENIYRQFCFIQGELSEAFQAYNKNFGDLGEELADVCIYILGLCQIKGINLESEILKKLETIKKRKYIKVNDVLIKEEDLKKINKG